jgi:outer membrane protein assembly factor BamB
VFVGSNDGNCYCLNRTTGAVLWSFLTQGWVDSSPAVDDDDDAVYFATSNGNGPTNFAALYKLRSATGAVVWSDVLPSADGLYDPVVSSSAVFAGSLNSVMQPSEALGHVISWDKATGERRWMHATGGHLGAAAALAADALYIGDRNGKLFKLGPSPADGP